MTFLIIYLNKDAFTSDICENTNKDENAFHERYFSDSLRIKRVNNVKPFPNYVTLLRFET